MQVGDKMPDTGVLHLPSYLDKTIMYGYMKADLEDDNEDVIHYSTFCHLLRDVFPHVKIPKVNRFTRCDYCTILGEEKRKARDRDIRKYLDKLFTFHNDLQMRERKLYYHHRDKAKKYPHDYACIAQDGMDQAKLLLPRLIVTAHAYANARKLRTHLTGVLNHGRQPKGYFDLFQYPHDANLTINILLFELQSMGEDLPDTLCLQMDNCWRENKNQFVLNFLAVLVILDIFVKVKLNFLMVGHTHEAVDQMFNKLSEFLVKKDTKTFQELMTSLEKCYTPSPKAVEVDHVFDIKEWMAPFSTTFHNISNPHAFKFTKAPSGKVVMQYKNWGSDKSENWKPDSPDPEQWITVLKEDSQINPEDVPDYIVPNTEKLELGKLRTDIEKFYKSRLFSEQHKTEWTTLLSAENAKWNPKERAATWPLQDIIANKESLREKQKLPAESDDNGLGFLGQKPEGVPADIDDMVRNQVAPVREVYGGAYRRQIDVTVVDNFEGVLPGSTVAVNLVGNYRPPHLAKVKQVTDTSFIVQWLKGGYKSKWVPWRGWTSTQIPKESVIYFDIELDENGKLKKEAAQYLRRRYKELAKQ